MVTCSEMRPVAGSGPLAGAMHRIAPSETRVAGCQLAESAPKRQPSPAEAPTPPSGTKPRPCSVTRVPPSCGPPSGKVDASAVWPGRYRP